MTTTTKTTSYRIIAESPRTGDEVILVTAKSLEVLVGRIEVNGEDWENRGYEQWTLEDNSMGRGNWTPTLREHLTAMLKSGKIDYPTFRELKHFTG
jgi:hypothetical protein